MNESQTEGLMEIDENISCLNSKSYEFEIESVHETNNAVGNVSLPKTTGCDGKCELEQKLKDCMVRHFFHHLRHSAKNKLYLRRFFDFKCR
jgi:hypothetical protein